MPRLKMCRSLSDAMTTGSTSRSKTTGKDLIRNRYSMKDASEKGFGLTTMTERVRMMGGILDLWSQEGKGTRITFSIPVEKGRD